MRGKDNKMTGFKKRENGDWCCVGIFEYCTWQVGNKRHEMLGNKLLD